MNRPDLRLALGGYYYDRKSVAGHDSYLPGERGDWASWEGIVESTVRGALVRKIDCYWVVWNEPDHEKFWPHGVDRYRETWRRAHAKIRSLQPEAVITGPTISRYSFDYLTSFLAYCKENACLPDMVTWHELSRVENHVTEHIEAIRVWCKTNGTAIRGIIVDEYGSRSGQHLPGPAVGFLSAFERARVTYAARALWDSCGTLCGTTSRDGKRPLSVWWVYKAYSDARGTLYEVEEPCNLRAVATVDGRARSVSVLVGNQCDREFPVTLVLKDLQPVGMDPLRLTVDGRLIANSGEAALEAPETFQPVVARAVAGQLKIDVGPLPGYAAAEVVIRMGDR